MGLFDFFKKKKDNSSVLRNATDNAVDMARSKAVSIENFVRNNNLPVDDFSVDVNDGVAVVYGTTGSVADKQKVLMAVGRLDGINGVDDRISVVSAEPVAPQETTYVVKSGDSLSKIAKSFYGDPMKYMTIFEANRDILSDPNMIHPGQELKIPQ